MKTTALLTMETYNIAKGKQLNTVADKQWQHIIRYCFEKPMESRRKELS